MDLGVGSFVFSKSLISSNKIKKKNILSSFPLFILGFVRFLMIRGADYQNHVTEYGVHWNFFLTLGFVTLICDQFNPKSKWKQFLIGSTLIIIYQYLLSYHELGEYILQPDNRVGWLNMNREGIYSMFGYISLYYIGQSLSNNIVLNPNQSIGEELKSVFKAMMGSQFMFYIVHNYIQPSSRRMHNLGYLLFIVSTNLTIIFGLMLLEYKKEIEGEKTKKKKKNNNNKNGVVKMDSIKVSFDRNQLILFILANLLTGIINLTFHTLERTTFESILILYFYSFLLSILSSILAFKKYIVKFW